MAQKQVMYDRNWWIAQLDQDEKRLKDDWWTSADQIIKKYKGKKVSNGDRQYLYNIFWANVGVLKAALYAKLPRPMVERTWKDQGDNVGRVAALILQRCLSYDLMKNNSPMDASFKLAIEDVLIPGLGCVWLRYDASTHEITMPGGDPKNPVKFEVISEESVDCDYVGWRDVVFPSARIWTEVWYVGRKIYLSKAEAKARFGMKFDDEEESTPSDQSKILPKNFVKGKVCVYEIWCKKTKKVYWLCREATEFFEKKDDFLKVEGFYPCPKFLMSTHTTDDFLPRPDYTMAKDQYDELNELNTRCVILEKALRVVGVYDKKNAEVSRILTDARENDMIPVEKWAVLAEQNGLKGVVDWFPIEMIANVLEKLTVQKTEKVNEIYELTGIADIMRGATNARETLGAQQLKSQYASVRLQYKQMDVSTFVREALIIKANIICRHFQDETIMKMSNIMSTPDAPYVPQALQLLRDSELTDYKIDINEEGLALPDYNQEKQTRIEFLTTVGQFLSQAAPITESMPGALPYLVQIVRWVAAGMRGSNEIQGVLDQAIQSLQQNPPQPKGADHPPPDPTKIQAEQIKQQAETQRVGLKAQADNQVNTTKANLDLRNKLAVQHAANRGDLQGKALEDQNAAQLAVQQAYHALEQDHHKDVRAAVMQERDHAHELDMAAEQAKQAQMPAQG